jgi:hypothetical protein
MVLTKEELIGSLQNEVRILLHLCTKIDRNQLDYRPTPKQRSTLELLRYLSFMGPTMVKAARDGGFDPDVWTAEQQEADGRDFDQTVDTIAAMADSFAQVLGDVEEQDFRSDLEMFGRAGTKGSFLVNTVLGGYAAYRTQLFLYLKACGREELNSMNLWAGMDSPPSS